MVQMTPAAKLLHDQYDKDWFANRVVELEEEVTEQEQSFDLYHEASMRGIKMWQEITGKDMEWPDQGHLTVWLLEKIEKLEDELNLRQEWDEQVSVLNLVFAKRLAKLKLGVISQ